jgi:hypothetical protein
MAKKKTQGEQLDLIEVGPENSKKIKAVAHRYKAAQATRLNALEKEIAEKTELLELIKKENLQTLEGGKIQLKVDGMIITVTPRDELIRVKEEGEEKDE